MADSKNEFLYTLEKFNSLPSHVTHRSAKWRRLREALQEMGSGEWIKVGVPNHLTNPKERERFCENIRSGGVYSLYTALGGAKKYPFRFPTHIERDENKIAVAMWVGKEPADKEAKEMF